MISVACVFRHNAGRFLLSPARLAPANLVQSTMRLYWVLIIGTVTDRVNVPLGGVSE